MNFTDLKNTLKPVVIFVFVIALLYFVFAGINYYTYAVMKRVQRDGNLFIPTGSDLSRQASILVDSGFLKDTTEYLNIARKMNYSKVYSGKYKLAKDMTYRDMLRIIGTGAQTPVRLTYNNIDDLEELASRLSRQIELDSVTLTEYFRNDTLLSKYDIVPDNVLYTFLPDTYETYWDVTIDKLLKIMKKEYDKFWSDQARVEALKRVKMTPFEVTILASIVEKECRFPNEMPVVAGVYINRLNKNMLLQADPTVKFAVGDRKLRRILYKHLEIDSPYNTYKYKGLPPTPISSPSKKAIDAVLNYEDNNYLYFCASEKMDGTHRFATSFKEHSKNARNYAKALNEAGVK